MKQRFGRGKFVMAAAVLGIIALPLMVMEVQSESEVPTAFDNQGNKIFSAQLNTPEINLAADSGGRNLRGFYALRQYPGSPPRIPHEVDMTFSGNDSNCLSCHGKGGFSPEYGNYAPVTPHPENVLCYQCHTRVQTKELFVESAWESVNPPRLGQSFLSSSPPPVPHSLQLRENCLACHTGPAAVVEIRISHASRGDCRQCHATVVQTSPPLVFKRK